MSVAAPAFATGDNSGSDEPEVQEPQSVPTGGDATVTCPLSGEGVVVSGRLYSPSHGDPTSTVALTEPVQGAVDIWMASFDDSHVLYPDQHQTLERYRLLAGDYVSPYGADIPNEVSTWKAEEAIRVTFTEPVAEVTFEHIDGDDGTPNSLNGCVKIVPVPPPPEPEPIETSVTVTPACDPFDTEIVGRLTYEVAEGAVVSIEGVASDLSGSDTLKVEPGEYSWSAEALDGYVLVGPSSGTVTVVNCRHLAVVEHSCELVQLRSSLSDDTVPFVGWIEIRDQFDRAIRETYDGSQGPLPQGIAITEAMGLDSFDREVYSSSHNLTGITSGHENCGEEPPPVTTTTTPPPTTSTTTTTTPPPTSTTTTIPTEGDMVGVEASAEPLHQAGGLEAIVMLLITIGAVGGMTKFALRRAR
jgi:hypothetical protein